jgi:adenylyl- and sulfurtransferase ThiI
MIKKVLLISGGIAEPVAAMATLKCAGIDSVIYEAHPQATEEVVSCLTLATHWD